MPTPRQILAINAQLTLNNATLALTILVFARPATQVLSCSTNNVSPVVSSNSTVPKIILASIVAQAAKIATQQAALFVQEAMYFARTKLA